MPHRGSYWRQLYYEDQTNPSEDFDEKRRDLLNSIRKAGLDEALEHELHNPATLEVVQDKTFFVDGRRITLDFALCLSKEHGVAMWVAADGKVFSERNGKRSSERKVQVLGKNANVRLRTSITWPAYFRMNFHPSSDPYALALVRFDIVRWAAQSNLASGLDYVVSPDANHLINALNEYLSVSRLPKASQAPLASQPQPAGQPQSSSEHRKNAATLENPMPPQVSGPHFPLGPHTQIVAFSNLVQNARPGEPFSPGISKRKDLVHRPEPTAQLQTPPTQHICNVVGPLPSASTEGHLGLPQTVLSSGHTSDSEDNIREAVTPINEPVSPLVTELRPAAPVQESSELANGGGNIHAEQSQVPKAQDSESDAYARRSSEEFYEHSSGRAIDYSGYHCGQDHCTISRLARNVEITHMAYLPSIDTFQFAYLNDEDYMDVRLRLGDRLSEKSEIWHELWVLFKPTPRKNFAPSMEFVRVVPISTEEKRHTIQINGGIGHHQLIREIASGLVRL